MKSFLDFLLDQPDLSSDPGPVGNLDSSSEKNQFLSTSSKLAALLRSGKLDVPRLNAYFSEYLSQRFRSDITQDEVTDIFPITLKDRLLSLLNAIPASEGESDETRMRMRIKSVQTVFQDLSGLVKFSEIDSLVPMMDAANEVIQKSLNYTDDLHTWGQTQETLKKVVLLLWKAKDVLRVQSCEKKMSIGPRKETTVGRKIWSEGSSAIQ